MAGECRTPIGGNSTAIIAEAEIQKLSSKADQLLTQVNDARAVLIQYEFPILSVPLNVDNDTQLEDWARPNQPELDYSNLIYQEPLAPTVPALDAELPKELEAQPPNFDSALIAAYVAKLKELLDGAGLPPEWENAVWNRARGRVDQDLATRSGEARNRLARAGWNMPTGVEEGLINQITYEGSLRKNEINREVMIRVHEVAIQLLLAALERIGDYLRSWIAAYEAEIRGETALLDNRFRFNQLLLQQLDAQLRIYEARSAAERQRVASYSDAFRTESGVFGSLINESTALAGHAASQLSTSIQQRSLDLNQQIENNRIRTTQRRADIDTSFQLNQVASDILSRTLVSVHQAMDVGTSASASFNDSFSSNCSTNYTFRSDA